MTDLPVIESCDGCGACCMQQSSPPGYLYILSAPEHLAEYGPFAEDAERVRSLPPEAVALLNAHSERVLSGAYDDLGETPCCWLDLETRRCRFYEHRPSICRDGVELGDEACRSWRDEYHDGRGARSRLSRLLAMFRHRLTCHTSGARSE